MVAQRQVLAWLAGVGVFAASLLTPLQRPWDLASARSTMLIAQGFWVVLLALAGGVSAAVVRRRIWPIYVVALVSWLVYSMWPAMVVASFYAASQWDRRWLRTVALTLSSLIVVVPVVAGADKLINGVRAAAVMMALMIVTPYIAGLWVRTRHRLIDELNARNDILAAQTRAEERNRIAREMHDVVAHRVALMVLHAGGLELGTRDEHTAGEAAMIRANGREALNELRQVLGVLRKPDNAARPPPLLEGLDELVAQIRRAGISAQVKVEGEPREELPAAVERGVYRLVQEALTNVVKHAPGANAEVLLRNTSDSLKVIVRNGPPAAAPKSHGVQDEPLPSSGLGLIGLGERVGLLGGEFEVRTPAARRVPGLRHPPIDDGLSDAEHRPQLRPGLIVSRLAIQLLLYGFRPGRRPLRLP